MNSFEELLLVMQNYQNFRKLAYFYVFSYFSTVSIPQSKQENVGVLNYPQASTAVFHNKSYL